MYPNDVDGLVQEQLLLILHLLHFEGHTLLVPRLRIDCERGYLRSLNYCQIIHSRETSFHAAAQSYS